MAVLTRHWLFQHSEVTAICGRGPYSSELWTSWSHEHAADDFVTPCRECDVAYRALESVLARQLGVRPDLTPRAIYER